MVRAAGGIPRIVFRRELDRRSVLRGAAALGLAGAVAGAYRWRTEAWAQEPDTTADLMNFARTVEGLLCKAYEYALEKEYMTPRDDELLRPIMEHEVAYVELFAQLVEQAGGRAVELPAYNFTEAEMDDRMSCLRTLSSLEELSIKGWHGQIPTARDPRLVPQARPIVMAKARHAAVVAMLLEDEGTPFPAAIEQSITLEEVLDGISQYRGTA